MAFVNKSTKDALNSPNNPGDIVPSLRQVWLSVAGCGVPEGGA